MVPPDLLGLTLPSPLRPAPWQGADLACDEDAWSWTLDARDVTGLTAAARSGGPVDEGWASSLRRRFAEGPGVLRLRGLPVDDERLAGDLLLALGQALGPVRRQTRDGSILVRVQDEGRALEDANGTRAYRTRGALPFHVDGGRAWLLLCVRAASSGGTLRVVSSSAVLEALSTAAPDAIARLARPWAHDAQSDHAESPVFETTLLDVVDGRARLFLVDWLIRDAARHPGVSALAPSDRALLDRLQAIAEAPGRALALDLAPGDVIIGDNHRVLHGRDAWTDGPSRRLLLRVWLEDLHRPAGDPDADVQAHPELR